jgi:hypothetical protein
MVLEIMLVLQLIKEIQEVLEMDTDEVQGCVRTLRRIGLFATVAQAWEIDPISTLMELDERLRNILETIPVWRFRLHELIEMI